MILSDGLLSISLPDDLEWIDEFSWSGVEQSSEYTVTGALVVDVATRAAGRPITLKSGDSAWVDRATVAALQALADAPGKTMTLTLADAREFDVMFRLHAGAGIEAQPVLFTAPLGPADAYTLTLNLMEI